MPSQATAYPSKSSSAQKRVANAYTANSSSHEDQLWDLVQKYLPIVKSIVARMRIYFPESVESEDIYSVGLAGLIHAAQNFDSSKPNAFPSYAKIRVRGALLDELRRLDTLTRDARSFTKKIQAKVDALEQSLGHTPTQEEVCTHLHISPAEYTKFIHSKGTSLTPLDLNESHSLPLHEVISDPTEQTPLDLTENQDLIDNLHICITQLDPTSQKILSLYYLDELRLAEIAQIFNLTESRICQLHSRAISNLRALLKEKIST